ncbi:hypothetical protein C0584_01135 [Candidatus Parcubacteria bacterium]|nr:MAG: hypothetical protein C0584_01135 [Candidatus Parcubacteria bacterium]
MSKKEKILISLATLSFFLLVYLLIVSREIKVPSEQSEQINQEQVAPVDLVALESEYKETMKEVYSQLRNKLDESIENKDETNEEMLSLKNKVMGLTVPAEYRAFHISLVLVMDNIIKNDLEDTGSLAEELDKIGNENNWLK